MGLSRREMVVAKFASTEQRYNPYFGQFILGPKQIGDKLYVSHIPIKEGIWLSCGDSLTIGHTKNYEDKELYLLGEAYQSDPSKQSPLKELRNATLHNIDEISSSWAGRWLLVGYGRIFSDASSLLKCFYKKVTCNSSEACSCWFASNPVILHEVDHDQDITIAVEDRRALELGWVVPPRSGYKDIRVLLPSQCINIYDGTVEPRRILSISKGVCSYADSQDELIKRYSCILKNIASNNDNIWIPLTGGHDSRLLTAISHHVGVRVNTYTFNKPYCHMSYADKRLPPIIARLAGFEHHFFDKVSFSKERMDIYDQLSTFYDESVGSCYYYFVNGYWKHFEENTTILGGFCGELGRDNFLYKLLPVSPTGADLFRVVPKTSFNRSAISELLHWWSQNPQINLDDRDRFYWEARLTGWAGNTMLQNSLIFQFYNMRDIPMLNCMKVFEIILGMDEIYRIRGKYGKDIIGLVLPQAKNIPINPRGPFHKRVFVKLKQLCDRPQEVPLLFHRLLKKASMFFLNKIL